MRILTQKIAFDIKDIVRDKVFKHSKEKVRNQIWFHIGFNIRNQIWIHILNDVTDLVTLLKLIQQANTFVESQQ